MIFNFNFRTTNFTRKATSIFDIVSIFLCLTMVLFLWVSIFVFFYFFVQKININNTAGFPWYQTRWTSNFRYGCKNTHTHTHHPLVILGLLVYKSHYRIPFGRERRQLTAAQMHGAPLGLEITPKLSPVMISLCAGRVRWCLPWLVPLLHSSVPGGDCWFWSFALKRSRPYPGAITGGNCSRLLSCWSCVSIADQRSV